MVRSLLALRLIAQLAALTLGAARGVVRRFDPPPALMADRGLTPSEHRSGRRRQRGGITNTGNGVARRSPVEGAWTYRYPPRLTHHLQQKGRDAYADARTRAWNAQQRRGDRYARLIQNGTNANSGVTAIARERAGFIWDIARHERVQRDGQPTA